MELTVTTKNLSLTEQVEEYARKRLSRFDRRLRQSVPVRLTLRHEATRQPGQRYIAEVTASLEGALLRGEERASTIEAAIDAVSDVVDRQLRRQKTRRKRRREKPGRLEAELAAQLADFSEADADEALEESVADGRVVRVKRHEIEPMTVADAVSRMDLLGHSFYVFLNDETDEVNVVYRRDDGDYALIVPERAAGPT